VASTPPNQANFFKLAQMIKQDVYMIVKKGFFSCDDFYQLWPFVITNVAALGASVSEDTF
jgi:hypothetical protein